MDERTSRAAARLDKTARRIEVGMAVLLALLIAFAAWLVFMYYLLAPVFSGSDGA